MRLLRLVPDDTKFDFMRFRHISFPLSAVMSVVAIVLYFSLGLNFGIDFVGGTLLEVQSKGGPANLSEMRTKLNALNFGDVQLQQFGGPNDVLIRIPQQPGGEEAQQQAVSKVRTTLGDAVDYRRVEVVGPRVSTELLTYGTLGVMLAIIGILLYLWFRFEWQFALGACLALCSDVITTLGVFSLFKMNFDLTTVAAVLTIAGYSVNDSIVVYDRVREMLRKYKKMPLPELLNLSVNRVLPRTLLTVFTVFLTVVALLVFGGETLRGFSIAMLWGLFVGTFSSIRVGMPVLLYLDLRRDDVLGGTIPEYERKPKPAE